MDSNVPQLLRTYSLSLKEGHESSPVILEDDLGGDMFFTIHLKPVPNQQDTGISIIAKDEFHADIKVEIAEGQYSTLPNAIRIGTYKNRYNLLINVTAKPRGANDEHEIVLSFYITDKGNGN